MYSKTVRSSFEVVYMCVLGVRPRTCWCYGHGIFYTVTIFLFSVFVSPIVRIVISRIELMLR